MSTNDYIRQSADKYHWHKYYSFMRSISIGTHPKRELTQKEMEDFEMIRG